MTSVVETHQDTEAQLLMKQWVDNGDLNEDEEASTSDLSPGSGDYDEYLEQFRREVFANDNALDHVILGASDMDAALDTFEKMTGHRPVYVVSLNGLGTKSARIAFEEGCCFLEIVAPDPKQSSTTTEFKKQLEQIHHGVLMPIHYGVRRHDAKEEYGSIAYTRKLNVTADAITMVAKDRGEPWNWDMVILDDPNATLGQDGYIPNIVDWRKSHHAAGILPIVADKAVVTVRAPSTHKMHSVLRQVDPLDEREEAYVSNLTIEVGEPQFTLSFTAKPNGKLCTFTAHGTEFRGIRFPAEGGLPVKQGKF